MDQNQLAQFKNKLQEEKEKIIEELSIVAKEDKGEHVPGNYEPNYPNYGDDPYTEQTDTAPNEVEDYEVNVDTTNKLEEHLAEIEEALNKIETGEYGICEKCGAEIPLDRINANPSALTCVKCG
jgi:DnaK suppressor protein